MTTPPNPIWSWLPQWPRPLILTTPSNHAPNCPQWPHPLILPDYPNWPRPLILSDYPVTTLSDCPQWPRPLILSDCHLGNSPSAKVTFKEFPFSSEQTNSFAPWSSTTGCTRRTPPTSWLTPNAVKPISTSVPFRYCHVVFVSDPVSEKHSTWSVRSEAVPTTMFPGSGNTRALPGDLIISWAEPRVAPVTGKRRL